jgi:ABC-type glycerol-3-phosphate transport system permease component
MTQRGGWTTTASVLLFAVWAFPMYWMLISSVTPDERLFGGVSLLPTQPILDHYYALFTERRFWVPIVNSLVVAGTTTLLAIVLGVPAAYAIARLRFRGQHWISAAILSISVFPQIAILSPLFLLLRAAGLIDTYPGLVIPYLTFSMPLAIWLMTAFLRQLPRDLEEAALMDGASRLRTAVEIMLPLAAPGIATTAILTFLYSWNEFLFALSFTLGPDRQTVPVAIALFRGQYQVPWGQVLAAAVVASVPVAVVVLAFQRRIVSGLTAGAVKG